MEKDIKVTNTESGVLNSMVQLAATITKTVAQTFELVMVETRFAGMNLLFIFIASIGVFMLLMSVWILLNSVVGFFMLHAGYSWEQALFLLILINISAIIPLCYLVIKLAENIKFKRTGYSLKNLIAAGGNSHEKI